MHTYPATLYLLSTNTRIIMRMPVHSYRCPPYRVDAGTLLLMPTLPRGCRYTSTDAHLTAWMLAHSCQCPSYRMDAGVLMPMPTLPRGRRLHPNSQNGQSSLEGPTPPANHHRQSSYRDFPKSFHRNSRSTSPHRRSDNQRRKFSPTPDNN